MNSEPSDNNESKDTGEATFSGLVLSLGASALIALGENMPGSNQEISESDMKVDLKQAKELISIIDIIQEKTKGNLSSEEKSMLENLLYTLRIKFIEVSGKNG